MGDEPKSLKPLSKKQKRSVDVALDLWRATRERMDTRQDYEWRVSFGFWAALLLATRFVGEVPLDGRSRISFRIGAVVLAASVVFLHWFWLYVSGRKKRLEDTRIDLEIDAQIRHEIGLKVSRGERPPRSSMSTLERLRNPKKAGHIFQVGVTAVLTIAALWVLWAQ